MCDGYKNSVKTQNLHYIQISLYRGKITKQPKGDGKADISYKYANCFCVQNGLIKTQKLKTKKNNNRDGEKHAILCGWWRGDDLMSNLNQNYTKQNQNGNKEF